MTYLERTQQHYPVACLVLGPQRHSVADGLALEAFLAAEHSAVAALFVVATVAVALAVASP